VPPLDSYLYPTRTVKKQKNTYIYNVTTTTCLGSQKGVDYCSLKPFDNVLLNTDCNGLMHRLLTPPPPPATAGRNHLKK
jgi:hypothetical protein